MITTALLWLGLLCARADELAPDTTFQYYRVHGRNEREMLSSLKAQAVRDDDGTMTFARTDSKVRWDWRWTGVRGGRCKLASVNVITTVEMRLPQWEAPIGSPPSLIAKWNRFLAAARKHEDGHRDITLRAAEDIREALQIVADAETCDALRERLNTIADGILEKAKSIHDRYDRETGHGRTQGAVFP